MATSINYLMLFHMSFIQITKVTSNRNIDYQTSILIYLIDASSKSITVTLPPLDYDGIRFYFKRIDNNILTTVKINGYNNSPVINLLSINPLISNLVSNTYLSRNQSLQLVSYNNSWQSL